MTLPAPNPPHQDAAVPFPVVSLARVLALLRVLAGPRGSARVTWWAGGFTYTVTARRGARTAYLADVDPHAAYRRAALARLRGHLLERVPDE